MTSGPASRTATSLKRKAIMAAGADLFLRHGYDRTSMDMVAEAARVSRQTIYNQFAGKEALFLAISADLVAELGAPLAAADAAGSDIGEILLAFGRHVLEVLLRPSSLAFHRLVVAEAARFPDLGRAVYAAGAATVVDQLAAYLTRQMRAGRLRVPDPQRAAEQFFGMLVGHAQFRALMGVEPAHGPADRDAIAASAVDIFLRAVRSA